MSINFFKTEIKSVIHKLLTGDIVAKVYDHEGGMIIQTFNGTIAFGEKLNVLHIDLNGIPVLLPDNHDLDLQGCVSQDFIDLLMKLKTAQEEVHLLGRLLMEYEQNGDYAFSLMTPAEAGTLKLFIMDNDKTRK